MVPTLWFSLYVPSIIDDYYSDYDIDILRRIAC